MRWDDKIRSFHLLGPGSPPPPGPPNAIWPEVYGIQDDRDIETAPNPALEIFDDGDQHVSPISGEPDGDRAFCYIRYYDHCGHKSYGQIAYVLNPSDEPYIVTVNVFGYDGIGSAQIDRNIDILVPAAARRKLGCTRGSNFESGFRYEVRGQRRP